MKKKLLVVDDDPAVRSLMRRALQGAEYEVIEAPATIYRNRLSWRLANIRYGEPSGED